MHFLLYAFMSKQIFGLLGAALVPIAFLTVWQLTQSLPAAGLAGLAILTGKVRFTKKIQAPINTIREI